MQTSVFLFKKLALGCTLLFMNSLSDGSSLMGRWKSNPSEKGNVTTVIFRPDNHFDGFVNKKPFVTGTYEFRDSTLFFVDNGCNGKSGLYKVVFFSGKDSVRFETINDSCSERQIGMTHLVLGRIKN